MIGKILLFLLFIYIALAAGVKQFGYPVQGEDAQTDAQRTWREIGKVLLYIFYGFIGLYALLILMVFIYDNTLGDGTLTR